MKAKVPVIYSDSYYVDIGDHVFPTTKYRILKERIINNVLLKEKVELLSPSAISEEDLLRAHSRVYLDKLKTGDFSEEELTVMEVPYSRLLAEAAFTCCAGTMTAVREAIERSACAFHLGGGFHHAFTDHGEGFCLLNDIAVSVLSIRAEQPSLRTLIVDCDVHQGNGTASIFSGDKKVFTLSIHQDNNYPYFKQQSDLDIGLADGAGDAEYMEKLTRVLPAIIWDLKPGLIVYVAGADPYGKDQLGGLTLTKQGLRERDHCVLRLARERGIPVAVTLAGGYAMNREDTVDIHLGTLEECVELFAGDNLK